MSLEHAMKRLAIRPSTVCHQCRRTFASSTQREAQSATGAFAEILQKNRSQDAARPPQNSRAPNTSSTRAVGTVTSPYELARSTLKEISVSEQQTKRDSAMADLERTYSRADLEKQAPRRWKSGDVYAPHDLSGIEAGKWKKLSRKPPPTRRSTADVMDQLGINPVNEYKNFSMMSEFVTDMGRIQHRNLTGLRPVNQRRMTKAIRRAIGLGLMPSIYRHPQILKDQIEHRGRPY